MVRSWRKRLARRLGRGRKRAGPSRVENPTKRKHWLQNLVNDHGFRKGAELGLRKGETCFHLLKHCPDLHMIGVDLFDPQHDHAANQWEGWDFDELYKTVQAKAERYPGRCELHRGYTHDVAKLVEDASLDFVFIDADHSYEGCSQDIVDWTPKVRPGGFVAGHDINWPSVRKAVEELVEGFSYSEECDNVWWKQV